MRTKNHIKADNDDLRGIGKLDWTESSKMHSTIKKLESTFDNDEGVLPLSKKTNKITVTCPLCKSKFKTNSGKLPKHKTPYGLDFYTYQRFRDNTGFCKGFNYLETPIFKVLQTLDNAVLNNKDYKPGDRVLIDTTGWNIKSFPKDSVIEAVIEQVIDGVFIHYKNDIHKDFEADEKRHKYIYFKFAGYDEYVRTWGFHSSNLQKVN